MKFEEWVKGIENAAIKGLCSTHPNICKMIYNEGQKDIEKALKDKGVCLQSELDEVIEKLKCCANCKHSEEDNKSSTICDECFELCYWEMKE